MFNILSLFSGEIIIYLTGFCISILSSFDLVTASAVLFPKNSPVLLTTFSGAFSPLSNNCFLHFLANDKNPYRLTYFLVLGSIEYCQINVKLTLSSVCYGPPFLSVFVFKDTKLRCSIFSK